MAATRARHCFELLDETSDPALLRAVEQTLSNLYWRGGMRRTTIFHPVSHRAKKMPNLLLDSRISLIGREDGE